MSSPSVSVVILTRNRVEEVLRCIRSILAQDYPGIEIIVVDNVSTDDTVARIRAEYPQVIVLPQTWNTGVPTGRNIGMRHAKGDLCLCIDDDAELIEANAVTRSARYFEANPKLAALALLILDQHGNIAPKLIPRRDRKRITEDTPGAMFSGTGFVVRRSAFFEAEGFWDMLTPYFGEEPDVSYRLLGLGYEILLTPFVKVRHYESEVERPSDRRLYTGTRNTPWMALRSLPWWCVLSLTSLSWGYFFMQALRYGQLPSFFRGVKDSIAGWPAVCRIRRPIPWRVQKLVIRYSGIYLC